MAGAFDVNLIGHKELVQRLAEIPPVMQSGLKTEVKTLADVLRARVKSKLAGEVLHERSGKLMKAIYESVTASTRRVVGRVGASQKRAPYAAAQELGAFHKARIIEPARAKSLAFVMGGSKVFAKSVSLPEFRTDPHSFVHSAAREMKAEIESSIHAAIRDALALS